MSLLQRYTWNLKLIKNVEENIVFFSDSKVFNSDEFSIDSYKQEMRKSFSKETRNKYSLEKKKTQGFILYETKL